MKDTEYSKIDVLKKQELIFKIKDKFLKEFCKNLNLIPVSAPIFVTEKSGLQDRLSGIERPVKFDVKKNRRKIRSCSIVSKMEKNCIKKI